jgi:tellurite resistance protein TehA-like permease
MAVVTTVLVGSSRFLIYATVLLATGIFGATHDWRPGLILAIAGLIVIGISIGLLTKFFRQNTYRPEDGE